MRTFNVHHSINYKSNCSQVFDLDLLNIRSFHGNPVLDTLANQELYLEFFHGKRKGKQHSQYPDIFKRP